MTSAISAGLCCYSTPVLPVNGAGEGFDELGGFSNVALGGQRGGIGVSPLSAPTEELPRNLALLFQPAIQAQTG